MLHRAVNLALFLRQPPFLENILYLLFSPHLGRVTQTPMEFYMLFVVTNGQKISSTLERTISASNLAQSLLSSAAGIRNLWWKDTCTQPIGFTHAWHNQITRFTLELRATLKTDFGNMDLTLVQLEKSHVSGTFHTGVKSAWHQHKSVTATPKAVLTPGVCTGNVPESWGAAILPCSPPSLHPSFSASSLSAAAATLLHCWGPCQCALSCHPPASCPRLQN